LAFATSANDAKWSVDEWLWPVHPIRYDIVVRRR